MSDTNVDPAVDESKRREQVIVMIAVVSTILGFKFILAWWPSPLRTDFDAFTALFIADFVVFFAAVGASFIWSHSVWLQTVAEWTPLFLLVVGFILSKFLASHSLWYFGVICIFGLHFLPGAVFVRPSAKQQPELESPPV